MDGGAHRGIWTRELARHFSRVVAFEPLPELAESHSGEIYIAALGEKRGRCSIQSGSENDGQGHVVEGEDFPVIALDEYRFEVDFLKLDVEGFELPALKGAAETIERCHPAIMVEQNGLSERYGYTDADLESWLTDRGYYRVARWNKDSLFL